MLYIQQQILSHKIIKKKKNLSGFYFNHQSLPSLYYCYVLIARKGIVERIDINIHAHAVIHSFHIIVFIFYFLWITFFFFLRKFYGSLNS